MLGMKFEEESEQGRAARLHRRINEEKTILIILDDIWAELELEKIGIPSPDNHKGCKLVLTSRNKHVLSNEMSTQKDFGVEHLQGDEAWILFKNMVGDSIENPDLLPIASDVAKECTGLPIAIVTVAKALKTRMRYGMANFRFLRQSPISNDAELHVTIESIPIQFVPKLTEFGSSIGNIIFPKLTHISLEYLPRLTSFSPGYHTLQKLDHADLDIPFAMLFNERAIVILRLWNWELLQQCDYTMSSSCATSVAAVVKLWG
ncbi:hypothetical protein AAG906_021715 [Vitis piasezkii]